MIMKKIAIFSPIPPMKSGISDYMLQILPEISKYYKVDIFIDSGYQADIKNINSGNVQIFNHQSFEKKANDYENIIFQLGNNEQHYYMVPYIEKYNGIIILHDYNIHGMARSLSLGVNRNKNQYLEFLKADYGNYSSEIMRSIQTGKYKDPTLELEINKYFLTKSKAVIVHNQFAMNSLKKKGIKNVHLLKFPVNLPKLSNQEQKNHFLFGSFGFLNQNKRIDVVIRCIKRLIDFGCHNIKYIIVGHENDTKYVAKLRALVKNLQLEEAVEFTSYVNDAEYTKLLQKSDVCILLRYPTVGESSAATLNALSYGKPVIVSNVDAFKEYPNSAAIKIPVNENEENELFDNMLKLYKNDKLRKRIGQDARNYISQNHSMNIYGQQIRKIVGNTTKKKTEPLVVHSLNIPQKLKTILILEKSKFIITMFEEFFNRKPQMLEFAQFLITTESEIQNKLSMIVKLLKSEEAYNLFSQPIEVNTLIDNDTLANIFRTIFTNTDNTDFIRKLYQLILMRSPEENEFEKHLEFLKNGNPRLFLMAEILLFEETKSLINELILQDEKSGN